MAIAEENSHDADSQIRVTDLAYLSAEKILKVSFNTGEVFLITAELLRVESPSAEVQGHSSGEKKTIAGRMHVGIINIEPVGNYAVKIVFDDLHDTGLYSWQYLYKLGRDQEQLWSDYLASLEEKGLSRDPSGSIGASPTVH
ncbi:DUF971 domain-containing protein [Kiloniella sp. b19]|uniref:DUF971 domain-containing protein n=1 Tax=Kiloniella sp. GXU_MW_B19 TaxID=3141326 RepID=UPI0031E470A3